MAKIRYSKVEFAKRFLKKPKLNRSALEADLRRKSIRLNKLVNKWRQNHRTLTLKFSHLNPRRNSSKAMFSPVFEEAAVRSPRSSSPSIGNQAYRDRLRRENDLFKVVEALTEELKYWRQMCSNCRPKK